MLKNNLAPFLINNFYINYLAGDFLENNLLYIITMLLQHELDKINKIEDWNLFLEKSKSNVGIFLTSLREVPNIQLFFQNVINRAVEKLEKHNIMDDLFINEEEKSNIAESNIKRSVYKKVKKDNIEWNDKNVEKINHNCQIFAKKYSADINLSTIIKYKDKAKKAQNVELCNYFEKIEEEIKLKNNEELFSNKQLMSCFLNSSSPVYLLSFYQNDLLKRVNFIEQLISDFEKNISLMPKFIKSICKIIILLLKNKFPNITKLEENLFISKFLMNNLLIYFLSSPNYNALIHTYIVSDITLKDINEIFIILKYLFIGKLYKNTPEENNYTPYNRLILENFEKILYIYENSQKIKLPNFIENYINKKLSCDYSYDYFTENEEKIYVNISICFTTNIIFCLIDNIKNLKNFLEKNSNNDKMIKLRKSLDKLEYEEYMNKIKQVNQERIDSYIKEMKEKKINIDINNLENYYILNIEMIDKKYEKLFSMNGQNKNFFINIKNNKKEQLGEKKKNLINLKNNISGALGNYRLLDSSDFLIDESSTLIEIFSELKKFVNLPNYTLNKKEDNSNINICNWHLALILNYINKIPEEYSENNYKKLFNELYENIITSINEINFEKLNLVKNKLIYAKNSLNYYETKVKDIKNIIINENIKIMTERIAFLVDIKFIYNENEKCFELKKSKTKDYTFQGNYKYNKKNNSYTLKTIAAFAKFFPNLSKFQFSMNLSPLKIINELSINQKLKEYFDMIKKTHTSNLLIEKNHFNELYQEKIVNYVMDIIFEKIYPPSPSPLEEELMKISQKISKNDLDKIVKQNYNLDNLLPNIIDFFQELKNARTPLDKYNHLKNILNYLSNLINFIEGSNKVLGADDTIPILYYIFVKIMPFMFISDIEFIKTFKCFLPNGESDLSDLIIFESIINKILNHPNNI